VRHFVRLVSWRKRIWIVALPVYWALLFTATHYPRVRIPGEIPHSDKLVHFTAFGLLAFLFWRALDPKTSRFVVWAGPLLIGYAGLDEWLQQFVGRFTDFNDFIANGTGIACVLGVLELRRRRRS
jgi:VanZ family protein